ncbi:aminodeoxychorismate/anthranilate synthase component II [Vampirovibrio sp.]|uniref:anthranilate synthase component II n=1 Tax=Vampirovibrio sp. TaxID=2717857 RepID=UPI0035932663
MLAQRPVVIIDNYDSFSYNLYQMTQVETEAPVKIYRNDQIDFATLLAKKPQRVILSPGPGNPAIAADFGVCADIIQNQAALDCPVLGVCLGHQGIAHYLGGRVIAAPEIVHGESRSMQCVSDSGLFKDVPTVFEAMRYHSLLVDESTLPEGLEITVRDLETAIPMAMQHRTRPIFGIQFHPESIGTPYGKQILRNFLNLC